MCQAGVTDADVGERQRFQLGQGREVCHSGIGDRDSLQFELAELRYLAKMDEIGIADRVDANGQALKLS
jgi:hypothetical protein